MTFDFAGLVESRSGVGDGASDAGDLGIPIINELEVEGMGRKRARTRLCRLQSQAGLQLSVGPIGREVLQKFIGMSLGRWYLRGDRCGNR